MNTKTNATITFTAGLGLLIPASIGLLVSGVPTILCPFPMLTILPALLLSGLHLEKAAVAVPMLLFFVWCPGLFRGQAKIPARSYGLFIVATISTIVYFVVSWKWGLQYQGSRFTHVVGMANIVCLAILGFAFSRSWRRASSFGYSLFVHWILFAWLAWCAFPYLGELP